MRILFLPLLAAAALSWAAQQPSDPTAEGLGNLSIPAQLRTTLKADKAHAGDAVHFSTVEAVLLGKGVIMPANTKLYGRVLGAAPRHGQSPSWISVVVERAEWKQHSLPLHAFIFGQLALPTLPPIPSTLPQANPDASAPNPSHSGRHYSLGDTKSAIAMARATDTAAWNNDAMRQAPFLEDVKLARQKSGATLLFSEKHNLRLYDGIFFMLQNVTTPPTPGASAVPAAQPK